MAFMIERFQIHMLVSVTLNVEILAGLYILVFSCGHVILKNSEFQMTFKALLIQRHALNEVSAFLLVYSITRAHTRLHGAGEAVIS